MWSSRWPSLGDKQLHVHRSMLHSLMADATRHLIARKQARAGNASAGLTRYASGKLGPPMRTGDDETSWASCRGLLCTLGTTPARMLARQPDCTSGRGTRVRGEILRTLIAHCY